MEDQNPNESGGTMERRSPAAWLYGDLNQYSHPSTKKNPGINPGLYGELFNIF